MPQGKTNEELTDLIARLSKTYSTPLFPPHVTLLGGLTDTEDNLLSLSRKLAARLRPFDIRLTRADYLDEFYRALFVRVSETQPLMSANLQARGLFGRDHDRKFMPHLSLLYGNLDVGLKEAILTEAGRTFDRVFPVDRLFLHCTTGDTQDWYRLGEFPITVGD